MKEQDILDFFKKENLAERYIFLVNKYDKSTDDIIRYKKQVVVRILEKHGVKMTYSSPEKLFYQNHNKEGINFRFLLYCHDELISCSYLVYKEKNNDSIFSWEEIYGMSLVRISEIISDYKFEDRKRIPKGLTEEELEIILDEYIDIYKSFVATFFDQKSIKDIKAKPYGIVHSKIKFEINTIEDFIN